jgi:hypothetical protein
MSTNSTLIHEWEDAPEPGRSSEDWPYPNRYAKSLITGDLADKIRERLELDSHVPVFITERVESGGYSEYTQESDYYHTITAGGYTVELGWSYSRNGINALTEWLDNQKETR